VANFPDEDELAERMERAGFRNVRWRALTFGIAARYGAALRVMPGRGHLMLQEPRWEEPAREIERWLGESGL